MRSGPRRGFALAALGVAAALLSACANTPLGPTVAVMPGPNKSFELFAQEDQACRVFAANAVGDPNHEASARQLLGGAATGAVIGAIACALAGDHRSAGAGAAIGTAIGATAATGSGALSGRDAQRRYDIGYQQCMFAKGNAVPGFGYGQPVPGQPYPR